LLAVGALAALGAVGRGPVAAGASARRAPRPAARAPSAFRLFAAYRSNLLLDANRVECNINYLGEHCSDANNSSVVGGGWWPKGTNDQYIFNGGLQVAAMILGNRASFGWAGDTVGAFIFDLRGDQVVGSALAGIYDSRNATDLENWPGAAYVRDTALFDASLIGRKTASDQDSWVRYWDGLAGSWPSSGSLRRRHSMGLLIDQRTLAWNRPEANRDILYVIMRLINVTARDRSRYTGLSAAGYTPEDIDEIARIGADYHARSDTGGVNLPDTGFTWTNLYLGVAQDPDVGQAGSNYSTAILPFATAIAYKSNFSEPTWTYPAEVYSPPFATAPGMVGTKFLRAAGGLVTGGSTIRMYSTLHDENPLGVAQLWRKLASRPSSNDYFLCNAPLGTGTPVCRVIQTYTDTRWMMSNGPWPDLPAGQSLTFVIAYVFAAPVASAIQTDNSVPQHTLGSQAFDLKPGFPGTGQRLAAGTDTVMQIERVAGWLGHADANANGDVEQSEVRVQPYSLLAKARVAQVLSDNKFALAQPPSAPRFYVLPGDNRVAVVWERSATEVVGDPYFALASDPLGALYDPNFRQFDVEGYRIWRGLTPSSMELVAQFDYVGTTITDHTGGFFYPSNPQCAPELARTLCPVPFNPDGSGASYDVWLTGNVIQVPPGGRVLLASGTVVTFQADTAVIGGGSGLPPLRDTGVRYSYVDETTRNGTPYYYAVTAFDVNAINSGPSSLESDPAVKRARPRVTSSNARAAVIVKGVYGGDGTPLDREALWPRIDAASGTFKGPIPPGTGGSFDLLLTVPELLPVGDFRAVIDSVSPALAFGYGARQPTVYVTFSSSRETFQRRFSVEPPFYAVPVTDTAHFQSIFPFIPYDSVRARRFGIVTTPDNRFPVSFSGMLWPFKFTSLGIGLAMRFSASSFSPESDRAAAQQSRFIMHSYWYDEGGPPPPDPTIDPFGSNAHTNGRLSGVDIIYSPIVYRLPTTGGAAARSVNLNVRAYHSQFLWYPADFVVTWGNGGEVTVRDSTHRVNLPFKKATGVGYGFLNASAITGAGYVLGDGLLADGNAGTTFDPAVISYYSLYATQPTCSEWWGNPICADLEPTARLQPIDYTGDGITDGTGIALIVNAEPFYLLMSGLPSPGTKWHLTAVGGGLMTATCTPALPTASPVTDMAYANRPSDCTGYAFRPIAFRPAVAPGLQFSIRVTQGYDIDSTSGDLSRIHTVPDPLYWVWGNADATIRFLNLPERAVIRIYTVSGILVTTLTHNDPSGGGEEAWDVRNRGGPRVASGVYFWHVEGPDGRTRIGRFTVVQQGP
jgi:hypothetical protein